MSEPRVTRQTHTHPKVLLLLFLPTLAPPGQVVGHDGDRLAVAGRTEDIDHRRINVHSLSPPSTSPFPLWSRGPGPRSRGGEGALRTPDLGSAGGESITRSQRGKFLSSKGFSW